MTLVFLDTCAVVRLFVQEPGSAWLLQLTRGEASERVALLDLARVELHSVRAYDAVQLAGAIEAGGNEDVLFVTADSELASAAGAEGLRTLDPAREDA